MLADIDYNFGLHATTIPARSEVMNVCRMKSLSYVDSGLSCDTFNIIHVFSGNEFEKQELADAVRHFRKLNLDFCIWVSSENLTPKVRACFEGLELNIQGEEVGMVLDLDDYEPIDKPRHVNIQKVNTREHLMQYAEVIARNWNPADENVIRYYEKTAALYLDQHLGIELFLYLHGGIPVAGMEMFPSNDEVAGLYGLATLEAYRGKGIGFALMTHALITAKASGYKRMILQASEDGIGIYKKLGFRELTNYFEYS
ncbi:GNAT family N-acetyltransferase [Fulvivirga ulvae]|uniref:GNAT family N-acetyltransferase n=1 Tax=Fulvivirga ulvae TaxID=2904245 RepID=UPI001F43EADF|nr:GNAT family N-acetyltransferase [Fulvivirga ulvae]UII29715.1 GNAT family N-acetyltransferase [Fulvivirga ulvae]